MTANAFAEDVQLAKNTGMNEHIAKPLDLNKLNDVLKQWLWTVHCSKARDTVDRAIKKHEMKNAEKSLPMWEEPSAFV